jgi:hypothetical protein
MIDKKIRIFSVNIDCLQRDNFDFLNIVKTYFKPELYTWLSSIPYTTTCIENHALFEITVHCWVDSHYAVFYFLKFADHS